MSPPEIPLNISVAEASQLVKANPGGVMILDVREPYEVEICQISGAEVIPMGQVPAEIATLPRDRHLLVLCHRGIRSLHVTRFLRTQGFAAVSNIAGGIEAWAEEIDPAMARY